LNYIVQCTILVSGDGGRHAAALKGPRKMKLQTLFVLGAALIALDAVQASYAASDVYFPASSSQQATQVPPNELQHATVRGDALASAKDARPSTWHEFGTVWHDETLSSQTRAQVAAEAVKAEHAQTRSYFAY
jgi:hypothetical protein